jgi:hypothetical protein
MFNPFHIYGLDQSCKKSDLQQEENVSQKELQQLKSFVATSTGFPLSSVEYNSSEKYFAAGKDILVDLADARTRLRIWRSARPLLTEKTSGCIFIQPLLTT